LPPVLVSPLENLAFLFVIRDKLTGTLLFIGRVEDPTEE
jgi:serine protease inhibitor